MCVCLSFIELNATRIVQVWTKLNEVVNFLLLVKYLPQFYVEVSDLRSAFTIKYRAVYSRIYSHFGLVSIFRSDSTFFTFSSHTFLRRISRSLVVIVLVFWIFHFLFFLSYIFLKSHFYFYLLHFSFAKDWIFQKIQHSTNLSYSIY